jgi:hypothetical protein
MNSQEVAYGFGQLGSGHTQLNTALAPPTGSVIVAIQFLDDISLSALVADTSQGNDAAFIGTAAQVAGNGSPVADTGRKIDSSVVFPAGTTIVGRWTSVTMNATNDSGIICYFGK